MVKIVNGIIVQDNDPAATGFLSDSQMSSGEWDLNVTICDYKFNKWMILGVVCVSTLILGLKGCILSCLVFFAAHVMSGASSAGASSAGAVGGGGSGGGGRLGRANIKGMSDLPKPVKRG